MSPWVDVARDKAEFMAAQEQYGRDIQDWLRSQFPELCSPAPHPAAIAAVIRLRWLEGPGKVTAAEHGQVIRDSVRRFDAWVSGEEAA